MNIFYERNNRIRWHLTSWVFSNKTLYFNVFVNCSYSAFICCYITQITYFHICQRGTISVFMGRKKPRMYLFLSSPQSDVPMETSFILRKSMCTTTVYMHSCMCVCVRLTLTACRFHISEMRRVLIGSLKSLNKH